MAERKHRKNTANPDVTVVPLLFDDLMVDGEFAIGMLPFDDGVTVVTVAVQALSTEQRVARIEPVTYIVTHTFAVDLADEQACVLAIPDKGRAQTNYMRLAREDECWVLDTCFAIAPWENDPTSVLAKRVAITSDGPRLLGDSPPPRPIIWKHTDVYPCGDTVLRMASDFIMECAGPDGAQRWRLRLAAHLYTAVELRGTRAYFGVAGNGGRFYCIDPATGTELYSVVTGGTELYDWWGEDRIVFVDQRKVEVMVIDAHSGAELARVRTGLDQIRGDAPRLVRDGVFFTTGFLQDRTQKNPTFTQHVLRVDLAAILAGKGGAY